MTPAREYKPPSAIEKAFNRIFGYMAGLGLAPSFIYLLEVKGRKSGKTYSTAVNLLESNGKRFLVAPRGYTQWVKNAEASGEVTLKRGARRNDGSRDGRAWLREERPRVDCQHSAASHPGTLVSR
jgi:deazaflavin-dependent oxidoreductase (nitroreductase family)